MGWRALLMAVAVMLWSPCSGARSVADQEYLDALGATPDMERGARYFSTCSGCHGPNGEGKVDGAVPRIAGQHFPVIVRQLVAFRHGQRWDILMENFADRHRLASAQSIADVARYVSDLDDTSRSGIGDGELMTRGGSVYFRLCESCHGPSGQGDAKYVIPRIGGQHYEYLRRQIHDAVDGRRPGFPASHVRLLARLDHDDIAGVADYLSRILVRSSEPDKSTERPQVLPARR